MIILLLLLLLLYLFCGYYSDDCNPAASCRSSRPTPLSVSIGKVGARARTRVWRNFSASVDVFKILYCLCYSARQRKSSSNVFAAKRTRRSNNGRRSRSVGCTGVHDNVRLRGTTGRVAVRCASPLTSYHNNTDTPQPPLFSTTPSPADVISLVAAECVGFF